MRKLLHIPGGFAPPVAVALFGWSGATAVAVFLLAYLLVAWDLGRRGRFLPIAWALVRVTEREHEPEPIAATEFLVATLMLGLLFPLPYFFAAIALMGVGDGIAGIVGQTARVRNLPWNPGKTWAGLIAGAAAGTAAYVAFAIVGGQMQSAGFAAGRRLLEENPLWTVPAVLGGAFLALHAVAWTCSRMGWTERRSNASPAIVAMAFFVALAPTVAILAVAPMFLDGPLLPTLGGHGPLGRGLLILAPIVGMLVESAVRRHDNLWVPVSSCVFAYGLVYALGGL